MPLGETVKAGLSMYGHKRKLRHHQQQLTQQATVEVLATGPSANPAKKAEPRVLFRAGFKGGKLVCVTKVV